MRTSGFALGPKVGVGVLLVAAAVEGAVVMQATAGVADLPLWARLIFYFGLPLAMLVVLARYHVDVVKTKDAELKAIAAEKDAEIARLNEMRLKAASVYGDRLLHIAMASNELAMESNATLDRLGKDR